MSAVTSLSTILRTRAVRPVAVAVLAAAALSGCSVAGTDFHPGVAATIGSRTITDSDVDRLATGVCGALGKQLEDANQVVRLHDFKVGILQSLAIAAATEQVGEQYDVTPGDQYRRQVTATETNAGDLSDDEREALVVAQTTTDLLQDVLGQVGAKIAASTAPDPGVDDATPTPDSQEALQIGAEALGSWLKSHDVDINPAYGTEVGVFTSDQGGATFTRAVDTATSFGVSSAAEVGASAEPDQVETMQLPASQRCGRYRGAPAS